MLLKPEPNLLRQMLKNYRINRKICLQRKMLMPLISEVFTLLLRLLKVNSNIFKSEKKP